MKKKIYIILIIVSIILSMSFTVKADENDNYDIILSTSNKMLKVGDTVTIILKVNNINIQSGEKGIGAYEGTIVYDTNIFEELKMSGNELWDTPMENQGRFTSVKSDGICTSEAQEIAKITLKVKNNATLGNTKIQIKNFEASNGEKNISTEDTELTLKIEATQQISNSVNSNTNTVVNKTTAQNKIPYAGISGTLVVFIVIGIVAGIFSYIKYRRTY